MAELKLENYITFFPVDFVDAANLLLVVLGAIFAVTQIIHHRRYSLSTHTQQLVTQILEPEMLKNFEKAHNVWDRSAIADVENMSDDDRKTLGRIMNFFEYIGVFVKNGLTDEALLLETIAPIMIRYWEWVAPYVLDMRRKNNSTAYLQFQHTAECWRHVRAQKRIQKMLKCDKKIPAGLIKKYKKKCPKIITENPPETAQPPNTPSA